MRQKGMTLIEIMVASSIFLVLGSTLIYFMRSGINTWRVGEQRREAYERGHVILEQIVVDLQSTYPDPSHGSGGQVDVMFLSDYGPSGKQRLRFVRTLGSEMRNPLTQNAGDKTGVSQDLDYVNDSAEAQDFFLRPPGGLQEVLYMLDPEGKNQKLYRAIKSPIGGVNSLFIDENIVIEAEGEASESQGLTSAVNPDLVKRSSHIREFADGVLYLAYNFWSQDTRGWDLDGGRGPLGSWDSTRSLWETDTRIKESRHDFRDDIFPSRVQIVLVVKPARSAPFARLTKDISASDTEIPVNRTDFYPDGAFQYIRIGSEWIRYGGKESRSFTDLTRAVRETQSQAHERGTPVYYGTTLTRVIRIPTSRTSRW